MSLRNLWSLDPAEAIVAWEFQKHGYQVFFPTKDIGVDILLVRNLDKQNRKPITVQVKSSRYWDWKDDLGGYGGWFKLSRRKMQDDLDIIDFYVFVLFHTKPNKTGYEEFKRDFFIIPTKVLANRIEHYNKESGDMVNIYIRAFQYNGKTKISDYRGVNKRNRKKMLADAEREYSSYKDKWKLEI